MTKKSSTKDTDANDKSKKRNARASARDEQLQLIDTSSPTAKKLKPIARLYREAVDQRMAWTATEVENKKKIIEIIDGDKSIKADPATGIKAVEFDGMKIKITPRDELVQVKIKDDDESTDA